MALHMDVSLSLCLSVSRSLIHTVCSSCNCSRTTYFVLNVALFSSFGCICDVYSGASYIIYNFTCLLFSHLQPLEGALAFVPVYATRVLLKMYVCYFLLTLSTFDSDKFDWNHSDFSCPGLYL